MKRLWLLGALIGCGDAETEFRLEYRTTYCEQYLTCEDPAILTFDGFLDVESCETLVGPDIVEWGVSCDFKGRAGNDCLAELSAMTCEPGAGMPQLPAVCEQVFVNCSASSETDSGSADTDSSE